MDDSEFPLNFGMSILSSYSNQIKSHCEGREPTVLIEVLNCQFGNNGLFLLPTLNLGWISLDDHKIDFLRFHMITHTPKMKHLRQGNNYPKTEWINWTLCQHWRFGLYALFWQQRIDLAWNKLHQPKLDFISFLKIYIATL